LRATGSASQQRKRILRGGEEETHPSREEGREEEKEEEEEEKSARRGKARDKCVVHFYRRLPSVQVRKRMSRSMRQERGVCVGGGREGGREGWMDGGRESAPARRRRMAALGHRGGR
jgi:hypothetical protein